MQALNIVFDNPQGDGEDALFWNGGGDHVTFRFYRSELPSQYNKRQQLVVVAVQYLKGFTYAFP